MVLIQKRTNSRTKRIFLILFLVVIVLAGLGLLAYRLYDSKNQPLPENISGIEAAVLRLDQQSSSPPAMRLADGVMPPTNKWFSSLVFSKETQPIYAYPITFKPTRSGFEIDYPLLTSSSEVVFQSHRAAIKLDMGADSYKVSRYDDLSVELTFYDSQSQAVAAVTITHGSPFVFIKALRDFESNIAGNPGPSKVDDTYYTVPYGERRFGVVNDEGLALDGTNLKTSLKSGASFSVFALPQNANPRPFKEFAKNNIVRTSVTYKNNDDQISTTVEIEAANGGSQLFAAPPHMTINTPRSSLGSYDSLMGPLAIHEGKSWSYQDAVPVLPDRLDLSRITESQKSELQSLLRSEINTTKLNKPDSYFGGKELYRAANLLQLAEQLDMQAEMELIRGKLRAALDIWLAPEDKQKEKNRHFYYDTTLKGLVGVEPAFGSETFNDHHFHFGYFLFSAAKLAQVDPGFIYENRDMVDALVADLSNPLASAYFPRFRVFDPYVGHSWASGFSDFNDGNNQESSSEAVNAWYASYLWADVTDNEELKTRSLWLYQQESQAALRYWFRYQNPLPAGYKHSFVSLIWGGKLDYATFFSPRPQAKLGIQLIPMSPGMKYLDQTKDVGRIFLNDVLPAEQDIYGQFGDYLVMYEAILNPDRALEQYQQLSDTNIDDANSRSYVLAWIYSRKNN